MKSNIIIKGYIFYFFIFFSINISICIGNYSYLFEAEINENELEVMNFKGGDEMCQKFVPSLFSPIILIPREADIQDSFEIEFIRFEFPFMPYEEFALGIFNSSSLFLNKFNIIFGQDYHHYIKNCFFGLSPGSTNSIFNINLNYSLLNYLYDNKNINKRVFSFDKWDIINEKSIKSHFYLGDIHYDFSQKDKGIIGACKNDADSPYWGCYFNAMSFNDRVVSLKKNENYELYKIYFSSESYDIFFPRSFEDSFNNLTENRCAYYGLHFEDSFLCCLFFDESNYYNLKLINNDMNITIEIDSAKRFSQNSDASYNKTRIRYFENDYFIFPLIMFKQFHVQFDAENNIISFFTKDSSILEVINVEKLPEPKGLSKVLLSFIVIISILAIAIISFIILRFIRKKKDDTIQKDIKKIEDIEEFHNMN